MSTTSKSRKSTKDDLPPNVKHAYKLTKVIQRHTSDPSWAEVFTNYADAHKIPATALYIEIGTSVQEELTWCRREIEELRAIVPRAWQDFEDLAKAKGHTSLKQIAEVLNEEKSTLTGFKRQGRVTLALYVKLAQAPVRVKKPTSRPRKQGTTAETIRKTRRTATSLTDTPESLVA